MSKVEKALQKARAMDEITTVQVSTNAPAPETMIVNQTAEMAAFTTQIPRMSQKAVLVQPDMAEAKMIFPEMEDVRVVDAFRQIRTHILQGAAGGNCVVLVTSVVPHGGASFVARNLAAAFAFDETKTALLVDCRLRKPSLDQLVTDGLGKGLADYLRADDMDVARIIHDGGLPRLRLIPAGRKTALATEQLGSHRMKDLIANLRMRYPDRYIVLDTASPDETADMAVLSALADMVILVVPYGRVTEAQIWTAAKAIDEDKFLGVVFNDEPQPGRIIWN